LFNKLDKEGYKMTTNNVNMANAADVGAKVNPFKKQSTNETLDIAALPSEEEFMAMGQIEQLELLDQMMAKLVDMGDTFAEAGESVPVQKLQEALNSEEGKEVMSFLAELEKNEGKEYAVFLTALHLVIVMTQEVASEQPLFTCVLDTILKSAIKSFGKSEKQVFADLHKLRSSGGDDK
jgi:hypothetical protein